MIETYLKHFLEVSPLTLANSLLSFVYKEMRLHRKETKMENMNITLDNTLEDMMNVQIKKGKKTISVVFRKVNGRWIYWEGREFSEELNTRNNDDFQNLMKGF